MKRMSFGDCVVYAATFVSLLVAVPLLIYGLLKSPVLLLFPGAVLWLATVLWIADRQDGGV